MDFKPVDKPLLQHWQPNLLLASNAMKFLIQLGLLALSWVIGSQATALDDYVWAHDDNYKWTDMGPEYAFNSSIDARPYQAYVLNMTSQRWLTDADFSAGSQSGSIWWHYLVVIVPENVKYTRNGTLWITGYSMSTIPDQHNEDVIYTAALATNVGIVTGILFQIPNEHTTFSSDPIQKSRTEDAIIAFTWDHFLNDPSKPEWLLRFPMVKASLRAMDTITEFMKTKRTDMQIDYYGVAGASKRGWTTWDVGAVDPKRVMAIVPVVLDAINFVAVEHHQYRSYGCWSYALVDYTDMNITARLDDPNMVHLQENVDPFWYKDRLTMPKLVVNAGMDEFQQPDDTHYWWADMPEPKHFMMIANAEHSLITGILEAVPGIGAFLSALLEKEPVPTFDWTIADGTGDITVTVGDTGVVHSATLWYAHSCGENANDGSTKRRDFRIAHLDSPCTCGPYVMGYCVNLKTFWMRQELPMKMVRGKRTYTAHVDMPTDGTWTAFFVELKFLNKHGRVMNLEAIAKDMKRDESRLSPAARIARPIFPDFGGFPKDLGGFFDFTTEVSVIPQTFPYPDCTGAACGVQIC